MTCKFRNIELRQLDGRYILTDTDTGEDLDSHLFSDTQLRNIRLAARRFSDAVHGLLNKNVKEYQKMLGYNELMGCKINLPCSDCKAYQLNDENSDCMFREDDG